MYSQSSSFLGGANSARPGPQGFGQQPSYLQPGQGQPNPLQAQQTAFPGGQFQPQPTGFQLGQQQQSFGAPQQQPQPTGFPGQNQQSFLQPNQQQNLQSQALQQTPQRTGLTSSQIANSFAPTPAAPPTPAKPVPTGGAKIPKIRLSFLTASDQAKFEQLFKSAAGDNQALDGDTVRDLLLRSKLPGSQLKQIWELSDTTKSGQLLFPEFALAMYLCNLKITGKDLPATLPERIANEVLSMVDIISFGIPDDRPQAPPRTNIPNFDTRTQSASAPSIQQPQPKASNSQLLSQIASQPTGFASQYIPPQPTGFFQANQNVPQPTGFQPQQTGFQPSPSISITGFGSGLQPPGQNNQSSFNTGLQPQPTGQIPVPLNAQPTGRPGQWGLVNAPATGLPNIEALSQRMMPQPGREGGFTTAGLSGSATVPWAVTKDEKKIYDALFKAWDGFNKGFISGDVAIEVMGQSGLGKSDLERIWTLSDPNNKGRLNMDEFAVAMHLIYRKLNGYPVPTQLPPELVPPSTRNIADSIGTVKSLLTQDAETRKNTGAFLQPQQTGVSYLKNHSFRNGPGGFDSGRKDATVFRNNDDDVGYKSSARRRLGGDGRTPSPVPSSSPTRSDISSDDLGADQLKKKIREKQILLDAMDFDDENQTEEDDALDRRDRREAEDLYRRLRRTQEDIDANPNSINRSIDSDAERRTLKRQLQGLTDRLPELSSNVRKTERAIADAKLELFRLKDAKAHPDSAGSIVGTGPGGSITESDRLKARAKAMMQQRSAALTGRKPAGSVDTGEDAAQRLEAEQTRIRNEREGNERMVKDVEESVRDFAQGLEDSLKEGSADASTEHEKRRWEEGLGVEDEVKDFIFDLQRSSRSARLRHEGTSSTRGDRDLPRQESRDAPAPVNDRPSSTSSPAPAATGGSYSSYKTAEERAAFIKQQAEQRMAERLAALGLKPPTKSGESKAQAESKAREEKLRQAELEDAKREEERQKRLADENPVPDISKSVTAAKKPPPPPSRKGRSDSAGVKTDPRRDVEEERRLEQQGKQKAIMDQQQAQQNQTKALEDEAQRQEDDLAKEREATEAKLKALQEQVQVGKIRKQEEKARKKAAEKEAKDKEAKLAAHRAEMEAAKERERQLQLQLQSLDDDSSSDDDDDAGKTPTSSMMLPRDESSSQQITPATTSPTPNQAQIPTVASPPPAPTPNRQASSSISSETKNPFFKKLSQPQPPSDPSSTTPSNLASPAPAASTTAESTNPFARLTAQQETSSKSQPLPPLSAQPTGPTSRRRPEEDNWSVVDSGSSDDEEDDDAHPTSGSAKQLASMLFGTMAPPRPMSASDDTRGGVGSPPPPAFSPPPTGMSHTESNPMSPPPAPPMPGAFGAPPAPPPPPPPGAGPPPPPPPMMPGGAPSAPPMPPTAGGGGAPAIGALLGAIQRGKGLRKTATRDKSAAVVGKVLS